MDLTATIDVAIGLTTIYFVLSIVASTIFEYYSRARELRAQNLREALIRILPDRDFRKKFLDHPLIESLAEPPKKDDHVRPNYIPSDLFAEVVMNLLLTYPQTGVALSTPLDDLRSRAIGLKEGLSESIGTLIGGLAAKDVVEAKGNLARWFDDSMDRTIGEYKRRSQSFMIGFGLLIAGAMNVDTIAIATALTHPEVREATVVEAQKISKDPQWKALVDRTAGSPAEAPKEGAAADAAANAGAATKLTDTQEFAAVTQVIDALSKAGIPWGWRDDLYPTDWKGWVAKAAGILITAFAVSFGAPFWFDLLSQVANLRAAGKVPDKAEESSPKKKTANAGGGPAPAATPQ